MEDGNYKENKQFISSDHSLPLHLYNKIRAQTKFTSPFIPSEITLRMPLAFYRKSNPMTHQMGADMREVRFAHQFDKSLTLQRQNTKNDIVKTIIMNKYNKIE